jgi:integrative and conjugative element protein (TIGR02256 family)
MPVHLPISLLRACEDEVSRTFPLESGGVLMGQRLEGDRWQVDDIIGPGPKASHARYRFSPDLDYQRAAIASRFFETAGHSTYLGDWHSHPKACHGRLSYLDRNALRKIMDAPAAQCDVPLMMILWGTPREWQCTVWRVAPARRSVLYRLPKVAECDVDFGGRK